MSVKALPKVVYDKESDSLYIVLSEGFEESFIELAPNISLEIGEGGKIIGIEILEVSKLFERLVEGMSPLETLTKLRGCVEFKDKKKMLSEIHALRAERRL